MDETLVGAEVDVFFTIPAFTPVAAMRFFLVWLEFMTAHSTTNPRRTQTLVTVECDAGIVIEMPVTVGAKYGRVMLFRATLDGFAGSTSSAFTAMVAEFVGIKSTVARITKVAPLDECGIRGATVVMTDSSLWV